MDRSAFFLMCIATVVVFLQKSALSLQENCRVIKFVNTIDGSALDGHVIAPMRATTIDVCDVQCFLNHDCVSYNFGPSETNENSNICQLNNSTDRNGLKPKARYTYVETENACKSTPCLNNGKCQYGFTDKAFRCLCSAGFEGELCEKDVDDCASGPCQNGGSCSDKVNGFNCSCQPGFTGTQCEIDVDDCASGPCQNGASCSDEVNGFNCTCQPGFNGTQCEIDVDDCASGPCKNGGSCSDKVNGFNCSCQPGFNGSRCEIDVDDCASGPCKNGGSCSDKVNGFNCCCPPGFTGIQCEIESPFHHWILDGTDCDLALQGAATFVEQNGRTVLYLDGTANTFAETPAITIRQTDFTIAVWIKLVSPLTMRQMIYSDWSAPHQFWFLINDNRQLRFFGRRDSVIREPVVDIATNSSDTVQLDVWSHMAVTWRRTDRKAKLYINGEMKKEVVADDNPVLDLQNSGHTVYDIGLKRDNGETSHAYYSDLMVFIRDLSEDEITNDLFNMHPFRTFI
ncbi:uncharacterized protein LOC144665249 [Oculina patagonica]